MSGYPISVEFNDYYFKTAPRVIDFRLEDDNGKKIKLITHMQKQNDPNGRFSIYQHAIFPAFRLDWGSKYTAKIYYIYDGETYTKEWIFYTRSLDDVRHTFRVRKEKTLYTINSGEKYAFYIVPHYENERIGKLSWTYTVQNSNLEYIDSNTLSIQAYGSTGDYMKIHMQNGRSLRLVIR